VNLVLEPVADSFQLSYFQVLKIIFLSILENARYKKCQVHVNTKNNALPSDRFSLYGTNASVRPIKHYLLSIFKKIIAKKSLQTVLLCPKMM